MRTRTPVVVLLAAAIGAVACRRGLARIGSSTFAGGLALAGYGPFPERDPIAQQDLLKLRREQVERHTGARRRVLVRLLERTKAEYDRYTTGAQKEPPVLDFLIVSGGGDWGAFGAGFLKGWHKVPAHRHPDRAICISGRRAGDRPDRDPLSQPRGGLGEAARDALFPS
jgi:hypothetical protein